MPEDLTDRLAHRIKSLRAERGLSLDALAAGSGVSRATLSRLEQAQVSPTAEVLGKLCAAYGVSISRLLMSVEDRFSALVPFDDQPEWEDPDTGFTRRLVSPPAASLAGEVVECHLPPETRLNYDDPPRPGLEHHLILLDGALTVTVAGTAHRLTAGDCLRYQLVGASAFATDPDRGARYILVLL